jgi:hypothetical protein
MLPTIALTRWRIDMAKKKQPAQTAAAPPAPTPEAPKPQLAPRLSDTVTIKRVDNGFVLELSLPNGTGYRDVTKRVASGAAALQAEVAAWINPAPKKR